MRKTKNIFVVCLLMGLAGPLWAQDNELERAFDTFATQQSQAFDDFKSKADADFESFLRETWQAFDAFEPEIAPVRPEPVNPVEFDKSGPAVSPVDIRPDEVKMGEPSQEPVEVPVPSVEAGQPSRRSTMTFYGTDVKVAVDALKGFSLGGIQEGDVADAWRAVCGMDYEPLLSDCLRIRKEYHLGDWAYLQLTKLIGLQLYGKERPDEVAFLQMFLMNKSGYKVRLAKIDNGLHLLVAPGSTIYGSPYLRLNGEKYYVFEPQAGASMRIYTYKQDFADSKNRVSLSMTDVPLFSMAEELRTFASADGRVEVQVAVNRNLMDFYRDYPQVFRFRFTPFQHLGIKLIQHLFVVSDTLADACIGVLGIQYSPQGLVHHIDDVKSTGVFVKVDIDFLVFHRRVPAVFVQQTVAVFQGGTGQQQAALFLVVVDIRLNGGNVKAPLCFHAGGKT